MPQSSAILNRRRLPRAKSDGLSWADTGDTSMKQVSTTGMLLAGRVSGERRWAAWHHGSSHGAKSSTSPLGRRRPISSLISWDDEGMIFTPTEYQCLIAPGGPDRETIFRCMYNLTNSNGNAAIPFQLWANVTEQGDVRSVCAPCFAVYPVQQICLGGDCGNLRRVRRAGELLRVETETPFGHSIVDGSPCQSSGGPACLIETTLRGKRTLEDGLRRLGNQPTARPSSRRYLRALSRTAARSFNRSAFRRMNPVASVCGYAEASAFAAGVCHGNAR